MPASPACAALPARALKRFELRTLQQSPGGRGAAWGQRGRLRAHTQRGCAHKRGPSPKQEMAGQRVGLEYVEEKRGHAAGAHGVGKPRS